jgi:hypothetical protein
VGLELTPGVGSFVSLNHQKPNFEDPVTIRRWFALLKDVVAKYEIQSDDIWNFHKTAFKMHIATTGYLVTNSKRRGSLAPIDGFEKFGWATAIQGTSAGGQAILPFLIVAAQHHLTHWYQENNLPGNWVTAVSKNGLADSWLDLEWPKHFDLSTRDPSTGPYRLLIFGRTTLLILRNTAE